MHIWVESKKRTKRLHNQQIVRVIVSFARLFCDFLYPLQISEYYVNWYDKKGLADTRMIGGGRSIEVRQNVATTFFQIWNF